MDLNPCFAMGTYCRGVTGKQLKYLIFETPVETPIRVLLKLLLGFL